jgi:hypothetical protein
VAERASGDRALGRIPRTCLLAYWARRWRLSQGCHVAVVTFVTHDTQRMVERWQSVPALIN